MRIPNPTLGKRRVSPADRVESYLESLPVGAIIWCHYRTVQDPPPPEGYTWDRGDYLKGACGHWRRTGWGGTHLKDSQFGCQPSAELATVGIIEVPLSFTSQEALF